MYLPKPLYEAKPYLYLITGILVALTWGFDPFSVISSAALIIGGLFIIYLRFTHRRHARLAQEQNAQDAPAGNQTSDTAQQQK